MAISTKQIHPALAEMIVQWPMNVGLCFIQFILRRIILLLWPIVLLGINQMFPCPLQFIAVPNLIDAEPLILRYTRLHLIKRKSFVPVNRTSVRFETATQLKADVVVVRSPIPDDTRPNLAILQFDVCGVHRNYLPSYLPSFQCFQLLSGTPSSSSCMDGLVLPHTPVIPCNPSKSTSLRKIAVA